MDKKIKEFIVLEPIISAFLAILFWVLVGCFGWFGWFDNNSNKQNNNSQKNITIRHNKEFIKCADVIISNDDSCTQINNRNDATNN